MTTDTPTGRTWQLETPAQIVTTFGWREKVAHDQGSGTLEAPRVLYLEPATGATVLGPALIVEPWPLDDNAKKQDVRMSHALIRGDSHHRETCGRAPWRNWERDSCGTCALLGWGAHDESGHPAPNYAGWSRAYIQAREPIPRAWLLAFVADLNDEENTRYRDALRRDVATYGYRITDEKPGYRLRTPTADSVRGWAIDYCDGDETAARDTLAAMLADADEYDAGTLRAIRQAIR